MARGAWYVYVQTFFDEFNFVAKTPKQDDAERVAKVLRDRIRAESGCACLVRVQQISQRSATRNALDDEIKRNLERGIRGESDVEAFAAHIAAELLGTSKNKPSDTLADAMARYSATTKAAENKLLADPAFMAAVKRDASFEEARHAAFAAAAPFEVEYDKLTAANPNGYAKDSETAKQFEALRWAIEDAKSRTFAQHGWTESTSPKMVTEFLSRLKRIELNWLFDLYEISNLPRPTDLLWNDATELRRLNPFLPALPEKPDDGRQRYAALVYWCETYISRQTTTLLDTLERFYKILDATTVPTDCGARKVVGSAHAVALSEATDELYRELAAANMRLFQQHGTPGVGNPPGVVLTESDSLDGPWTEIPPEKIRNSSMSVGGSGADAMLMAALESATRVTAFPIDKWNAIQAARPGANHQRYQQGDVVSAADLAILESAAKLLRVKAPFNLPLGQASPDSQTLERLAERAAEKAVEVIEAKTQGNDNHPPTKKLPPLKKYDRQAWNLWKLGGNDQTEVARLLNREHGTLFEQGQVSRMCTRYQKYLDAGGLSDMVPPPAKRAGLVDPGRLELGARVDKRKPRPSDIARANDDDE